MVKSKRFVVGGFLLLVLIPIAYVGSIVTMNWITLQYVSHRLEIDAEDWIEVYQAFETRFQPGMTRQEVINILMEIDPNMSKDDFRSEVELYNKHTCQVRDRCTERVLVFRNTPLIGSAIRFDYAFTYDPEKHLVDFFGPGSPENFNSD